MEGTKMKTDLRFNLRHAGDIFADAVHKTADTTLFISRKIVRVYNLSSLRSRKKRIINEIIERVSALTKIGGGVSRDFLLSGMVARLNGIERELAGYKKQNNRLVSPVTSTVTKLGKALFGAAKKR